MFITRGIGLPDASIALRRKRLAAAVSRLAVSRKSIVCPVESSARYRYLSSAVPRRQFPCVGRCLAHRSWVFGVLLFAADFLLPGTRSGRFRGHAYFCDNLS